MMVLHDFSDGVGGKGTRRAMVVMDGSRTVAKAYKTTTSWIVRAYGFEWTDPKRRGPNFAGVVCRYMFAVRTVTEARKALKELTKTASS